MTAHTLPDDPVYAFVPSYDLPDQPQQIRIVFDGMEGYVPTALVALTLDDALRLCDRLNARLGLDHRRHGRSWSDNPWPPPATAHRSTEVGALDRYPSNFSIPLEEVSIDAPIRTNRSFAPLSPGRGST